MIHQLSDEAAMQLAIEQAQLAEQAGEVPVGAVVVRDGVVLGCGYNQTLGAHDPTAHAEIIALREAAAKLENYRLNGCSLFVTLEPCAMCASAILHARIARLVFAAWDPKAGAIASCEHLLESAWANHRVSWKAGVLQQPCADLLRDFFALKRE